MNGHSSRFAVLAAAAIAVASPAVQPETTEPTLTAIADGSPFAIGDARGHFVALHFLGDISTPECAAFVREYVARAPTLAGVRHIFAGAATPESLRAWAAQFGDDAASIYVDTNAAVALSVKLPADSPTPATVVMDPAGEEIFRHVGTIPGEHLRFDDFARRLGEKSRAPAIAHYNLPKGKTLAVEGYDVVAYVTASKAVKGRAELASNYRGVTYHFANNEHRRLFAANPERYIPTYGGWCASAMGDKGTKVEIDPKSFKVKDGRLFLFYKGTFSDALKDWNKHEKEWEPAADANWKRIAGEDRSAPLK